MKKDSAKIFESVIATMKKKELSMDSIMISDDEVSFSYDFSKENRKVNIRSVSKTITSLCLGVAISQGVFPDGVDENIMPYLSQYNIVNSKNADYLSRAKLKHLISLTLGHEDSLLQRKQVDLLGDQDLCSYALNYPLLHEPGEYFLYSNAPIYILSVVLQNAVGMKLFDFAKQWLFEPLEISDISWAESRQGYNMGCTGIVLQHRDFHKFGIILRDDGVFEGKQVVPSDWVKDMKTIKNRTPSMYKPFRALPKYAYGYNIWICKNGIYFCDGTDGQYIIIVPKKRLIITTMAHQTDMAPITECLKPYFE